MKRIVAVCFAFASLTLAPAFAQDKMDKMDDKMSKSTDKMTGKSKGKKKKATTDKMNHDKMTDKMN